MPESTDPVPQPSFTSSTYRAIAANTPLVPVSDRPIADQPDIQTFLNASSQGPISENLLHRFLTIAELYLRQNLLNRELNGLCVGYFLASENKLKYYYVSWGWSTAFDTEIQAMIEDDKADLHELEIPEESGLSNSPNEGSEYQAFQLESDKLAMRKLAGLLQLEVERLARQILTSDERIKVFALSQLRFRKESGLYQDSGQEVLAMQNILLSSRGCNGHLHNDGNCYTTPVDGSCPSDCIP